MKLPIIQRFQKQNYPGSPEWFTRFVSDLNSFTEIMWNILNNNITVGDNMDAQLYATTLRAGATVASNSFSFQSPLKHAPQALLIGQVSDQAAYAAPLSSAVQLSWTYSGPTISVTGMTGLTSGHTYSIVLVVL